MSGSEQLTLVGTSERWPLRHELDLGRTDGCAVQLPGAEISKRHARIFAREGAWWIEDLGSMNGTFVDGQLVERPLRLRPGMTIALGDHRLRVEGSPAPAKAGPRAAGAAAAPRSIDVRGGVTRIGRDPRNDVCLPDPSVSRFHAELSSDGDRIVLRDLGSFNGTRLDGRQIETTTVSSGSTIGIGPFSLSLGRPDMRPVRGAGLLEARSATVRGHDGATVLQPTSLRIEPRELVAIIGGSGAGKSTLLKALAGARPPTAGTVMLDHEPLAVRLADVGYVPQTDITHRCLTAREALTYGARLRLPPDTSRAEIAAAVARVLDELDLTAAADRRFAVLSGGEQKRVSVAMELLGAPSLVCLDEPTSGLDLYHQVMLMRVLGRLAHAGRTVVLVTHTMEEIDRCDRVLVMGRGGRLCYDGPPRDAPAHFGATSFFDLYRALEQGHAAAGQPVPVVAPAAPPAVGARPRATVPHRRGDHVRVLAARTARVMWRDRLNSALLVALAPCLAALAALMFGAESFARTPGQSTQAAQMLFVLTIVMSFVGIFDGLRAFVGERAIWARERSVGVRPWAQLGGKLLVLAPLAAAQALLLAGTVFALVPLHRDPAVGIRVALLLVLTGWVALGFGLLVSALVSNEARAITAALPILVIQLLFAGAIVPVRDMGGLRPLAQVVSARWSLAGTGSALRLDRAPGADPGFLHHYGRGFFAVHQIVAATVLLVLLGTSLALTLAALVRSGRAAQ